MCCFERRNRRANSFVFVCNCKRFDNVPMKVHRPEDESFGSRIVDELEDIEHAILSLNRNRCERRRGCGICGLFRGCRDRDDRFGDRDNCCN